MTRRLTVHLRFTAAAVAAVVATLVIAATAAADERTVLGDATLATGAAHAQQVGGSQTQALKQRYLKCEDAASRGALDGPAVMACSVVYEVLKQRVFGGSFEALVAWRHEAREGTAR